ncbi:hypothetical protein EDC01DRAFT_635067 [Geopyxis carbonaria]|nr:hypothetical protein EDC01DRAFT_635067 [Geopyxis carbonaria]
MIEADLKEYNLQLESVEAALKADPENGELQSLINELKEVIQLTEDMIAETTGSKPSTSATPISGNKREHPSSTAFESSNGGIGAGSNTYAVGDNVLARWTSGDNQLYPARITSVTGSSKNPVYLVRFTQYSVTEQLYPKDIKPAGNSSKKRKVDSPAASLTPIGTPNGAIISQPAAINAELAEARRDKKAEDAAPKPVKKGRKLEQKKVLEQGQKKWQEFAAKGVKSKSGKPKKIGEASMFRTPESVHGRVGFTGSGQPMRKDVARGKHIYSHADDEE